MDAAVNQVMENALLQAAQKIEDNLDDQIHKMDNLDEDDLDRLRQEKLKVRSFVIYFCSCDLLFATQVYSAANAKIKRKTRAMDETRARGVQPHRDRKGIFRCYEGRGTDGLSLLSQ